MTRALVIGLDAATFDLINPWLRGNKLPNLSKLINEGISGQLKSTIPLISPCAWTSFLTGRNPGKTGVFGFIYRVDGTYRCSTIDATVRNGTPIWRILNNYNKKVGFILPTLQKE